MNFRASRLTLIVAKSFTLARDNDGHRSLPGITKGQRSATDYRDAASMIHTALSSPAQEEEHRSGYINGCGDVTRHKSGLGSHTRYAVCRGSTPLAVLCVAGEWAEVGWNRGGLSALNVRILTVRGGDTVVSDGSWCYHYQLHTSGSPSHCAPLCYYPWCGGACRDLGQCKGKLRRNSGFMLQLLHT